MEVLVLHAGDIDDNFETLVGAYSTFDKAVAGSDAYSAWFGRPSGGFRVTPLLVDYNNTDRYRTFRLSRGQVHKYWLRSSAFKDRYTEEAKPTIEGDTA